MHYMWTLSSTWTLKVFGQIPRANSKHTAKFRLTEKKYTQYHRKDVPWATDHGNICFYAVRVMATSNFDQLFDLAKSLITAIRAWHRTSTTKHPQKYTCKILFVLHLSDLAKSPGQRSLETNKHTQSHKQTRWKHYSVTFASGWKHYLLTITDDNELHWVIWDRL